MLTVVTSGRDSDISHVSETLSFNDEVALGAGDIFKTNRGIYALEVTVDIMTKTEENIDNSGTLATGIDGLLGILQLFRSQKRR